MNINQYLMYQLELIKEITIEGKVLPAVKFELNLPQGIPYQDALDACDDFKITIGNMRDRHLEAVAAQKEKQDAEANQAVQAPIEPEVVA
jgi:hypothetical protein